MAQNLHEFLLRLKALFQMRRLDRDMADELAFHQAKLQDKLVRQGVSQADADAQIRRAFGNASRWHERLRELWQFHSLENLVRDVSFSLRVLRKSPGFTFVALLTLALGIGANTAIFSLVDALYLKPLPVPHPYQIVHLYARGPSGHYGAGFSIPEYRALQNHATSFSSLAAATRIAQLHLVTDSGSAGIGGAFVSANYFDLMGIAPQVGRFFLPEEDKAAGRDAVVVISDSLWRSAFASEQNIVGREIRINRVLLTIIGVAPQGFLGDRVGVPEDVWIPSTMLGNAGYGCTDGSFNCSLIDQIVGRLAAGQSPARAQAEVQSLITWSASDWPERPSRRQLVLFPARGESPEDQADDLTQMRLLMAVTASLLLIACANLAGLLLARGAMRRKEIALRMAIGARRLRVVRQLVTESFVLTLLGGTLSVGFSFAAKRALSSFFEVDSEGFHHLYDLSFDWPALAYSLAVTLLAGAAFGLLPALRASRQDPNVALKDGAIAVQATSARTRNLLVAGQIALSMVLVASAGLLVRSGLALQNGTNFSPEHTLVLRLRPELAKYTPLQVETLVQQVDGRLKTTPGVESTAFMEGGEGLVWSWESGRAVQVSLPGQEEQGAHAGLTVRRQDVSPNFFQTLRTPLLQGREFTQQDRPGVPRVAIINEALAERLWSSGGTLGRNILVNGASFQVVGVAADMQPPNSFHAPEPHLYLAYWQSKSTSEGDIRFAIRVYGDIDGALISIRRLIQSIDAGVPIGEDMPMSEQVRLEYSPVMLARGAMGFCGVLALCMSAIGLYSILAFIVRTRWREIGVRMALGARREDVQRLVVAQGMRVAAAGVGAGLVFALLSTRLEASLLYGVHATDPVILAGAAVMLTLVALLASWIPARRAASINPAQALRAE